MRIFFQGLGKLGLPVALALEDAGHSVVGWDVSGQRRVQILARQVPEQGREPGVAELLAKSKITLAPLWSEQPDPDIVMVAVQTPHRPGFDGCVPLSLPPEDFDYSHLREAVSEVASAVRKREGDPLVVVISTCLPGTFDRELRPLFYWLAPGRPLRFAYHPLFIAMGQVIADYRRPEFLLVGTDDGELPSELHRLYYEYNNGHAPLLQGSAYREPAPFRAMSITSAELTKVAYNAWLGYKLMLANGLAELADEVDANVDDVLGTLKLATDRLVSTRYMNAGMGDGGGCHPRDQIALSWLAQEVGLQHNTFDVVIRQREGHARWLADIWCDEADKSGLPMVMLGSAYKPNTNIQTGSAARLVLHYARTRGRDPQVWDNEAERKPLRRACFFIATPHDWVTSMIYSRESVFVDPWNVQVHCERAHIVRPGRRA